MNYITFGDLRSDNDLFLILKSKEIGSPKAKKREIDIEGGDGVLDLTELFGVVNYENRQLKFVFSSTKPFVSHYSEILKALHEQKVKITLSDDPDWYYIGRLSVGTGKREMKVWEVEIEADCEPYKYKLAETVVTNAVSTSLDITLANSKKRVVPTITTDATMQFAFGGTTYTASAGTFQIPELELKEGDNTVTVTGTGNVTFRYREGDL